MSTSNFERGGISLNKTGYSSVVRSMRELKNNQADYLLKVAMDIYTRLGPKTTRAQIIDMAKFDDLDVVTYPKMPTSPKMNLTEDSFYDVVNELFRGKTDKMLKPRQSGFSRLTNRDNSFQLIANGAYITFNGDRNFIEWNVSEGNQAVECAYADCLSKGLMRILDTHKWGRGEGGSFHYWDEYMSDGEESDMYEEDRITEPSKAWGNSEFVGKVRGQRGATRSTEFGY